MTNAAEDEKVKACCTTDICVFVRVLCGLLDVLPHLPRKSTQRPQNTAITLGCAYQQTLHFNKLQYYARTRAYRTLGMPIIPFVIVNNVYNVVFISLFFGCTM